MMVKTIYWKAGKSGVSIAAFVSMVETVWNSEELSQNEEF